MQETPAWFLGQEVCLEKLPTPVFMGFPSVSDSKESTCNAAALGSVPGLGRLPGGGHGNLLQYSCLENPHGQRSLAGCSPRGHSWAPKHHTAHHCLYANYRHPPVAHWVKHLPAMQEPQETQVWSQHPEDPLEEEMATHSSILGWRILWTEEPGALQSMGSQRAGHNKSTRPCVWLLHFSSSVKQFKKQ